MTDNTFEEQFPSLQDEKFKWKNCVGAQEIRPEVSTCIKCETNHTLSFEMMKLLLEKYCLDKQKVRDAINLKKKFYERASVDRYRDRLQQEYYKYMVKFVEELEKGLGL